MEFIVDWWNEMTFILLILLILLLIFIFKVTKADIIAPSALTCYGFIMASIILVLNRNRWYQIQAYTIMVIFTGVLFFFCGEISVRYCIKNKKGNMDDYIVYRHIKIPKVLFALSMIMSIFVMKMAYDKLLSDAALMGYSGTGYLFSYARLATYNESHSHSYFLNLLTFYYDGLAYMSIFILMYNSILYKFNKKNLFYLFALIPYLFINICSTNRSWAIQLLVFVVISTIMLWNMNHKISRKTLKKAFKAGFLAIVTFLIIFMQLGKLTGKTQAYTYFDTISVYMGSSIAGLNNYLKSPREAITSINDTEMISGILTLANRLGMNVQSQSRVDKEFVQISPQLTTNIYTVFKKYYHDLGYLGMLIICYINGFIFTFLYTWARNKKKIYRIPLYAVLIYYVVMQFCDELITSSFLSIEQIFLLISIAFFIEISMKPIKLKLR